MHNFAGNLEPWLEESLLIKHYNETVLEKYRENRKN